MLDGNYTYAEAARMLRVAESTLRRWVSKGRISCHRIGRLVRFTDDDLRAAMVASPRLPRGTPRRRAKRKPPR
jgi:excisionase family DNA binding protein